MSVPCEILKEGNGGCRIIENSVYDDLDAVTDGLHTTRCEEFQAFFLLLQDTTTTEHFIKIFQSKRAMNRHKERDCTFNLHLTKAQFCGLESGTYKMTPTSGRKRGKEHEVTRQYLAIICKKNTVIFSWDKEDAQKHSTFTNLRHYMGRLSHLAFVRSWTIDTNPKLVKRVLLLTKHKLSISTLDGHMCLKMWDVKKCYPSSLQAILELNIESGGKLTFCTNRAERICAELREFLGSRPLPGPPPGPDPSTDDAIEEYYRFAREQSLITGEQRLYSYVDNDPPPALPRRNNLTIDLNVMAKQGKTYIRKSARTFYERQHEVYSELPALPPTPGPTNEPRPPFFPPDNNDDDISRTLAMVLGNPQFLEEDTLRLSPAKRRKLCLGLYNANENHKPDWEYLAGEIGLTYGAVILVKALVLNQLCSATAGEIILLHWQHMYNTSYNTDSYSCEQPCTPAGLMKILEKIGRHDLVNEMIT